MSNQDEFKPREFVSSRKNKTIKEDKKLLTENLEGLNDKNIMWDLKTYQDLKIRNLRWISHFDSLIKNYI